MGTQISYQFENALLSNALFLTLHAIEHTHFNMDVTLIGVRFTSKINGTWKQF